MNLAQLPIKIKKRVYLQEPLFEMRERKRQRINPTHRWNDTETKLLLAAIVDEVLVHGPRCFEKPTAMRFYEKVTANVPEIKGLAKWSVCKSKMRYLKQIYMQAHEWQKHKGAALLAEGNHRAITDYMQKFCPFWELLDKIFGATINSTNESDDPLLVVLREGEMEEEELELDDEEEADDSDSDLNRSAEEPDFNSFKNQFKPQAPPPARPKPAEKPAAPAPTTKFSSNSGSIAVLVAMQEKKLLFEETKWQQQQECEVQKLAIEREKCKLRKLELRQQHEIKRLEIERDERLAMAKMKLESESEERIKKYELDLRVKSDLY